MQIHAGTTNRLIDENSPYLKQHAHNPVDWYPWGNKALEIAKKKNKLIFLSIGYSTCHWCHVMERESFENQEVADALKKSFVAIKMDREEYPHIDRHYQDLYTLLNRRAGGWPLTIVMTPDAKPFFAATYLPPYNQNNRAGLIQILVVLEDAYYNKRDEIDKSVASIDHYMREIDAMQEQVSLDTNLSHIITLLSKNLTKQYDPTYGGFGKAPKFPQATTLSLLLTLYTMSPKEEILEMVRHSLGMMANGGINDQIEGGFYRYSVDERWEIPHFEKMLYTNAELLETYVNAYTQTGDERFKQVIHKTVENIEFRFLKDGLYYSASDADSEGEEGAYFVFEYDDTVSFLKEKGFNTSEIKKALDYFGITKEGNFEHHASNPALQAEVLDERYASIQESLFEYRQRLAYPFIDYKIQASWNALWIKSLFVASTLDKRYADMAEKALDTLMEKLYIKEILYHQIIVDEKPTIVGYLEDYAFVIDALLEGYQATQQKKYLALAAKLAEKAKKAFLRDGVWYMAQDYFNVKASLHDNTYRSAMAVMIDNLIKLSYLTEDVKAYDEAMILMQHQFGVLSKTPHTYPTAAATYLKAQKGYVVIKSTKERLAELQPELSSFSHPFILLKESSDEAYMACGIDSCFAKENEISLLKEKIK